MDSGSIGWIIIIFIVIGLPTWLHYRNEALKLKAKTGGADNEKLLARVDALEKQCAKMQEQINDAHNLLVDERRLLDQKLNAMLPDAPASSSSEARSNAPMRVRQN